MPAFELTPPFAPPFWLKNPLLQSVLNSAHFRAPRRNPMVEAAREMILTVEGGVRLQGFFSPQPGPAKGLAILLHGWEGSHTSTYMLTQGAALFAAGFSVFRLNLRDHGQSHHLNQGIFRAYLLDEAFDGVRQAAALAGGGPVVLAGFSLGGNFALRIAIKAAESPIAGLAHVLAIAPVLEPEATARALDATGPLRKYSVKKWRRSLARKQELFPELYDFGEVIAQDTVQDMTRVILAQSGEFDDPREYYATYAIAPDALLSVRAPLTIVTAQDDPVIPYEGFARLALPDGARLAAPAHGGHGGFLLGPPLRSWLEPRMVEIFNQAVGG